MKDSKISAAEAADSLHMSVESQINEFSETDETEEDSDGEISFADLGLDETVLAAIEKKGFKTPSPIQVLAIPYRKFYFLQSLHSLFLFDAK